MLVLVLNEIHCLNNVEVVQGGGNTKLCRELLDILLFRFILSSFPELLNTKEVASAR